MSEKILTRVDDDGITMEWNEERRAWFPKLDDELIYRYNLNYGVETEDKPETEPKPETTENKDENLNLTYQKFSEKCQADNINVRSLTPEEYNKLWVSFYTSYTNLSKESNDKLPTETDDKLPKKRKRNEGKANTPAWFNVDESQNHHIYVDNLPKDITLEEFIEFVSKVGMIMKDPITNNYRIKLYKDTQGNMKGDGIACYIKVESVDLALQILDGYTMRGGNVIKVSRAKFELKGEFDPKKRRRLTNKEKKVVKKKQDKLFSWGMELKATRPIHHNTVIIKNAFDPVKMKEDPALRFDIEEIYSNSAKQIGVLKRIVVHELHPDAVVQLVFPDPNFSDIAVEFYNNKIFNGRSLTAELWDGKSKFKVTESEEEAKLRLKKWDESLGVINDGTETESTSKNEDESEETVDQSEENVQEKVDQSEENVQEKVDQSEENVKEKVDQSEESVKEKVDELEDIKSNESKSEDKSGENESDEESSEDDDDDSDESGNETPEDENILNVDSD